MRIALAVDAEGRKHALGVREAATEAEAACTALLAVRGIRLDRRGRRQRKVGHEGAPAGKKLDSLRSIGKLVA
jgi:hypothetical protein